MNTPLCRNPSAASKVNMLSNSWVLTSLLAPADTEEAGSWAAAIPITEQAG